MSVSLSVDDTRLPVTIITGFLGSGKTTLLNHILKTFDTFKVAALVNEFGDINIDSQFLIQLEQDMIELTNGCICCTINNDLRNAVYRVLERRERIDYLVVETTGVADPLPITLTFLGTELRDLTRLDSILTLVDAETYAPDLFNSQAAYSQIAYGDIIILNKTDLASEQRLTQLEQGIHQIKAGARILRAKQGQVPLPMIIDVHLGETGAYQVVATEEDSVAEPAELSSTTGHDADSLEHSLGHDHHEHHDQGNDYHHHDHHHSDHLDNDGFISVSFQSDRPLVLRKFQQFLDHHLPTGVFRAKGIVWFQESPARHFFQLTGKRFQLQDDRWIGPRCNQLVFIGRDFETTVLLQHLQDCLGTVLAAVDP